MLAPAPLAVNQAIADEVIAIDLKGVFHCLRAVAPIFTQRAEQTPEARSNGKVVNVTSVMGLRGTILFLCSPDADYVTGHVLNVSGGMHIGF